MCRIGAFVTLIHGGSPYWEYRDRPRWAVASPDRALAPPQRGGLSSAASLAASAASVGLPLPPLICSRMSAANVRDFSASLPLASAVTSPAFCTSGAALSAATATSSAALAENSLTAGAAF